MARDDTSLGWINAALADLDQAGLRRTLATREGPQRAEIVLNGATLINFGSNDYLGLAADPRLAAAVREAVAGEGWGSGASPLVTGRAGPHRELEAALAEFEGTEAALLFASGFAANAGTIQALVGRGDAVYSDAKNHASIIDGCRLSGAEVHVYRHGDCNHLATLLKQTDDRYRRRLIATDALFSMDGDLAPLAELAELAARRSAMLLVDEAHATGVFGPGGRGVAEELGVEQRVGIRIGTLSKALGSVGGFVCGRRPLIDYLANRARSYVFSTAPPAAAAAAARVAVSIVVDEPQRRTVLRARAAKLRATLRRQGWNIGQSESQIIPIIVGAADRTMWLAGRLRDQGLLVPGIRPPSVPAGQSLLRLSLNWGHTPTAIDRLTAALAELAK
jgi:8-amino-7-oxononanoate synthase